MVVRVSNIRPDTCPSCGGPLLDLRGHVFNPSAVASDGQCVLVTNDDYTCAKKQRERESRERAWRREVARRG